jgi:hypothetical protein
MRTEGLFFAREGKKFKSNDEDREDEMSTGRCYFGHLPLR